MDKEKIVIAAKCAPEQGLLSAVCEAGLGAVELYLDLSMLEKVDETISLCTKFPLRYALHAPVAGYHPKGLRSLADALQAEIVVCHNIYWDDEWQEMYDIFKGSRARICVENTYSVHEPVKYMRRYHMGMCLDLEHVQMECAGVYEGPFVSVMRKASHIHMTGYTHNSQSWHTHIHHSEEHNHYLLDLLCQAGYSGLVVSEADQKFQILAEFKKLNAFYRKWENE